MSDPVSSKTDQKKMEHAFQTPSSNGDRSRKNRKPEPGTKSKHDRNRPAPKPKAKVEIEIGGDEKSAEADKKSAPKKKRAPTGGGGGEGEDDEYDDPDRPQLSAAEESILMSQVISETAAEIIKLHKKGKPINVVCSVLGGDVVM